MNWSSVKFEGSLPCQAMITPIVSRISESTETRPLSAGSHSWSTEVIVSVPMASLSLALFQPREPKPDCHGSVYSRVGSKETFCSLGMRFFAFGISALSSFCA